MHLAIVSSFLRNKTFLKKFLVVPSYSKIINSIAVDLLIIIIYCFGCTNILNYTDNANKSLVYFKKYNLLYLAHTGCPIPVSSFHFAGPYFDNKTGALAC